MPSYFYSQIFPPRYTKVFAPAVGSHNENIIAVEVGRDGEVCTFNSSRVSNDQSEYGSDHQ